jgi:hypothetical protein
MYLKLYIIWKPDLLLSSDIKKMGKDPIQVGLSSILSNMFMENFEMATLEQTDDVKTGSDL